MTSKDKCRLTTWAQNAIVKRELYCWPVIVACEVAHDDLGFRPSQADMVEAFGRAWANMSRRARAVVSDPSKQPDERVAASWRRMAKESAA